MIKFFKNVVVRIVSILLLLLFIASIFLFKDWYVVQCRKLVGMYYIYQGDKAYTKGELNNAVKYYNMGLKDYPGHSQARCNLANIYVSYEDYTSAVQEYKTALKYNPKYMVCRMDLAIILAETLSQYDEAISEYQKVADTKRIPVKIPFVYDNTVPTKENKEYAYYNMGLAYRGKSIYVPKEKLKDNTYLKSAIKSYNNAIKINKKSYDSLYNLALTHHLLGNTKDAGLNYCRAIEIEPMRYEAHLNLGILLDNLKFFPEAISEFKKAGLLIDSGDYATTIYLNQLLSDSYKKDSIFKENNKTPDQKYADKNNEGKISVLAMFNLKRAENDKSDKKEKVDESSQNVILKNGKLYWKEESESEFRRRMKTCESKKIFKGMN